MRRFLVSPERWGETIALSPREARHAFKVLRLQVGDVVACFDGQGRESKAKILSIDAKGCEVALLAEGEADASKAQNAAGQLGQVPGSHAPEVSALALPSGRGAESSSAGTADWLIAQGLPKGEKLEQILQHGTELGMTRLWPLTLARSVVKLEPSRVESRLERWQRIAEEACKQCGRTTVPEVLRPTELSLMCQAFERLTTPKLGLVLYEDPARGQSLAQVLDGAIPPSRGLAGLSVWALIGPEGGLSLEEVQQAQRAGFVPVTLGTRVLRTETASLALLAILSHELQKEPLRTSRGE